jgi:Lrp/AsnC family transcriptional regulator, regulator for asnA, asnC and gidA
MNKIDEIDAKILKELLKDGRKSFAEIAERCGTSKDVIAKRYKKMKQDKIIVGATIQMNYRFFGYNAVANLSITMDPQELDTVINYIAKLPNIFSVFPSYNKRQIFACVTLRDLSELDHVKDAIKKQPTVLEIKTYLWTDIRNIHENLELGHPHKVTRMEDENGFKKCDEAPKKVDEIDKQIIEKLSKNGRVPFTKIAIELKTSTDTVIRRFERLKNAKAIKVVIQIDPSKIGYQAIAIFNLALMSRSDAAETVKKISEIPDVFHITKTSGDYDLSIMAFVKSFDHFFAIRNEIAKLPYTSIVDMGIEPIPPVSPPPATYISTLN